MGLPSQDGLGFAFVAKSSANSSEPCQLAPWPAAVSLLGRELLWGECLSLISPPRSPNSIQAISKQPRRAWLLVRPGPELCHSTSSEQQQRAAAERPPPPEELSGRPGCLQMVVGHCRWLWKDAEGAVTTPRGPARYPLSVPMDQRSPRAGPRSPSRPPGGCRCSHFPAEQVPTSWAGVEDQGSRGMHSACSLPFPFLNQRPCARARKHLGLRVRLPEAVP